MARATTVFSQENSVRLRKRRQLNIKIKYSYIIAVALVALSIVLAFDAFTSYMSPYLSVSQAAAIEVGQDDENEIRVIGFVANDSVVIKNTSVTFNLVDEDSTITVNYVGERKEFQEGREVVVIGTLVSQGLMEGHDMLVQCESKYEGGGESLLGDPIFLAAILIGSGAIAGTVVSTTWKRKQHKPDAT